QDRLRVTDVVVAIPDAATIRPLRDRLTTKLEGIRRRGNRVERPLLPLVQVESGRAVETLVLVGTVHATPGGPKWGVGGGEIGQSASRRDIPHAIAHQPDENIEVVGALGQN